MLLIRRPAAWRRLTPMGIATPIVIELIVRASRDERAANRWLAFDTASTNRFIRAHPAVVEAGIEHSKGSNVLGSLGANEWPHRGSGVAGQPRFDYRDELELVEGKKIGSKWHWRVADDAGAEARWPVAKTEPLPLAVARRFRSGENVADVRLEESWAPKTADIADLVGGLIAGERSAADLHRALLPLGPGLPEEFAERHLSPEDADSALRRLESLQHELSPTDDDLLPFVGLAARPSGLEVTEVDSEDTSQRQRDATREHELLVARAQLHLIREGFNTDRPWPVDLVAWTGDDPRSSSRLLLLEAKTLGADWRKQLRLAAGQLHWYLVASNVTDMRPELVILIDHTPPASRVIGPWAESVGVSLMWWNGSTFERT